MENSNSLKMGYVKGREELRENTEFGINNL